MPRTRPLPAPVRLPLGRGIEPADAYRVCAAHWPHAVWRDGSAAAPGRRRSFVAGSAEALLAGPPDSADPLSADPLGADPLSADPLGAVLHALRAGAPSADSSLLGWWGWFGYELGAAALGARAAALVGPAAAFLLATAGVEFDHDAGTADVVTLPGCEREAHALRELVLAAPAPAPPVPPAPASWSWRHPRHRYLAMIDACRAAIAAGDAYQLCLTNRIDVALPAPPDPVAVFDRLRSAARVPAATLLRIGEETLLSASPETFLTVTPAGHAASRPIKGTRRRDPDPARDAALSAELRTSAKERAENVMIVDLVRNDLSRVAQVGSVEVTGLLSVETYPAVHQLVSTVEADLAGDPLTAVRALFPAGSMTGAPKRAAVDLLHAIEGGPRGVYAGAAGRIAADGGIDLGVVIRSILLRGPGATIGTGGGITALSDPAAEWTEIELKARPLLAALGADC